MDLNASKHYCVIPSLYSRLELIGGLQPPEVESMILGGNPIRHLRFGPRGV